MPISATSGSPKADGDVTITDAFLAADGTFRLPDAGALRPGTTVAVVNGGTGSSTASAARTALGLSTSATMTPATLAVDAAFTGIYTSLYTAQGPYQAAREYALNGSSAFLRTNYDRTDGGTDSATALANGVMTSVAFVLNAGEVVTNLTFVSGNTAAGATPTHWWFALYSSAATPALFSQTVDQTTTAWAANTAKTLALGTPQTILTSGVYYASCMMASSGAMPSLVSKLTYVSAAGAIITGMKIIAQTSGSALTTTAPATITSATTVGITPLVIVT
jgi:hypothetical protein